MSENTEADQPQTVPDMVLVPRVATESMCFAADGLTDFILGDRGDASARRKEFALAWALMVERALADLAAVPPELEGVAPEMALKTGYEFLLKAQADIADARELSILSEYDGFARNAGVISKGRAKRIAELTDRLAARSHIPEQA